MMGTWPDWLAAFATLGALATTVIVILKQDRERKEHQARRVSAWCEWDRHVAGYEPRDYFSYVRNASESPLFDALVVIRRGQEEELAYLINVVPAHETDGYRLPPEKFPKDSDPPEIAIHFRDAAKQYWRIGTDGHLAAAKPHHGRAVHSAVAP